MLSRKTAALLCAGAFIVLLMGSSCSARRSEQYREEGDTFYRLGKFKEATSSYQSAEQLNVKNGLAKVGLGLCMAMQDQPDEAIAKLREAIQVAPDLEIAYTEAVRLLIRREKPDEAVALAKDFQARNPQRGGILYGTVLRQNGKTTEALDVLARLKEEFPKSPEVRVALAGTYLALQQQDQAEAELKTVLTELDEESIPARMMLIEVYQAKGKTAEIVGELRELHKLHPEDVGIRLGLARSLLANKEVDEAETIARELVGERSDSGWANYVLGSCLLERQQYSDAVAYLDRAATALPQEPIVARKLAFARSGGKMSLAPETPSAPTAPPGPAPVAAHPVPQDWPTLWQQAMLRTLIEKRQEFLAKDEPLVRETLVLASVFLHDKVLAEELARDLPAESPLHAYLAALKESKVPDLLQQLNTWPEEDGPMGLLRDNAFGYALAAAGMRAHGIQLFSQALSKWPDQGVSLLNMAQVFRAARMPQFGARCLQRLVAIALNNMDAHTLLFVSLREGGLPKEAQRAAETTFSVFPDNQQAILNLAQAYLDSGEFDLAVELLSRRAQDMPDNPAIQIALAGALLRSGKAAEAQAHLAKVDQGPVSGGHARSILAFEAASRSDWPKVVELSNNADRDQTPALYLLGVAALIKTSQRQQAVELLRTPEGKMPPGGVLSLITLASLGESVATLVGDQATLANALAANGSALAAYAYGVACQQMQLNAGAVEAFQAADTALNGMPLLVGLILRNLAEAPMVADREARAKSLTQQHADWPAAWIGLADVMRTVGNDQGEREAIDKVLQMDASSTEAWRRRAAFAERNKDMAGSAEAYRHVVELAPGDPVAKNNLAYTILISGGDPSEALQQASAALEKMPTSSEVLHTLGVAQLRVNDLEGSSKSLAMALELRPGDPTLLLDFGQLLIAKGQTEEGRRNVELALRYADQLGLEFARRAEAEGLIAEKPAAAP